MGARTGGGARGGGGTSSGKLSSAERAALDEYDSGEFMWINNHLRGLNSTTLSASEKKSLSDLDSATNRKLKEQTLYRSVDAEAIFGKMSDLEYENLRSYVAYNENQKLVVDSAKKTLSRTKSSFTDKGFVSTTPHESVAHEWGGFTGSDKPIVLKMDIAKGTKGVHMNSKVQDGIDEILLRRNAKFNVKRIYGSRGNIVVHCKVSH